MCTALIVYYKMNDSKICIIGAGAMGGAVARGLVAGGYDPSLITVTAPHAATLEPFAALGISTTTSNVAAIRGARLVIFAVKPWILPAAVAETAAEIAGEGSEVSAIVAGVKAEELAGLFGDAVGRLRGLSIAMPNTAVAVRRSMTFIVDAAGETALVSEVFARLGKVMKIEEKLLPAATALASCGIAYAMRYVRAATEGGVELGFKAAQAQEIVAATLDGVVGLLALPGVHPETEIDKVTTPGGLTIRGLNAMEKNGFTNAVIEGLKAGR